MQFMQNGFSRAGTRRGHAVVLLAMACGHLLVAWYLIVSTRNERTPSGPAVSYLQVLFPVAEKGAPAAPSTARARPQTPARGKRAGTAAGHQERPAPAVEAQADAASQPAEHSPITPAPGFDMGKALSDARRIGAEPLTGIDREREQLRIRGADDTALAKAVAKAHRADCRTAHSGDAKGNLFVLIPILKGTLSDKGCKW
ncbi:hypothetical protein [Massilia aquatica]|uniref:Energy transducer TonB n=1 Tax=Massilia aquatica TaxID=2609000 RepID=A0ABX0MQZ9_9BURK|nr:hypothetical protein [Massilia aquatica]NHZ44646.1 hypothetical protein [Massilia aquatica]